MRKNYSISDLAAEFDVTTRTIRHYEDAGLLRPRREGLNRHFSHRDRARLKLALRAKRLGFSLAEIRDLFNSYDIAQKEKSHAQEFLRELHHHRALLEQQREDVEIMMSEIRFFETQCRKLLVNGEITRNKPVSS